jgi:23S rRNA pseudouridine2605 synthase
LGLVTSARDEKGRETVFDTLPEDMPRVMSIGRLDINSEGLLLLTNDGGLKRKLELPETGWLRKYRVRVNGQPTDASLAPLRKGLTVDGERFQAMVVVLDRQQGANAWLTIGIREGRTREIVNRLIRVSYGPFQLGTLEAGAVEEVKSRVLRDQLGAGADLIELVPVAPNLGTPRSGKPTANRGASGKPVPARGGAKPFAGKSGVIKPGPGKPGAPKPAAATKSASGKPTAGKKHGTSNQRDTAAFMQETPRGGSKPGRSASAQRPQARRGQSAPTPRGR